MRLTSKGWVEKEKKNHQKSNHKNNQKASERKNTNIRMFFFRVIYSLSHFVYLRKFFFEKEIRFLRIFFDLYS